MGVSTDYGQQPQIPFPSTCLGIENGTEVFFLRLCYKVTGSQEFCGQAYNIHHHSLKRPSLI